MPPFPINPAGSFVVTGTLSSSNTATVAARVASWDAATTSAVVAAESSEIG